VTEHCSVSEFIFLSYIKGPGSGAVLSEYPWKWFLCTAACVRGLTVQMLTTVIKACNTPVPVFPDGFSLSVPLAWLPLSTEPFSAVPVSAWAAVPLTVLGSSTATDVCGGCERKMYPKNYVCKGLSFCKKYNSGELYFEG